MTSRFALFTASLLLALITIPSRAHAAGDDRQYYELRVYSTSSIEQQKRINDYWQNAAVPAYNRLGIQTIGVFTEVDDSPPTAFTSCCHPILSKPLKPSPQNSPPMQFTKKPL